MVKVEGTDDIYDLTPAPGTVTEEGTFLNVENLLKDTTAAMFGRGADMVPDEALVALKNLIDNISPAGIGASRVATGSYDGTGTMRQTKTLNVGFKPKFAMVAKSYFGFMASGGQADAELESVFIWCEGVSSIYVRDYSQENINISQTEEGIRFNAVKYDSFNRRSTTYYYVMVG